MVRVVVEHDGFFTQCTKSWKRDSSVVGVQGQHGIWGWGEALTPVSGDAG